MSHRLSRLVCSHFVQDPSGFACALETEREHVPCFLQALEAALAVDLGKEHELREAIGGCLTILNALALRVVAEGALGSSEGRVVQGHAAQPRSIDTGTLGPFGAPCLRFASCRPSEWWWSTARVWLPLLEMAESGEARICSRGTLREVDQELEALQWLSVDELAAARRQAIRKLNLLDRSSAGYVMEVAVLNRTMELIGQVQSDRRHQR